MVIEITTIMLQANHTQMLVTHQHTPWLLQAQRHTMSCSSARPQSTIQLCRKTHTTLTTHAHTMTQDKHKHATEQHKHATKQRKHAAANFWNERKAVSMASKWPTIDAPAEQMAAATLHQMPHRHQPSRNCSVKPSKKPSMDAALLSGYTCFASRTIIHHCLQPAINQSHSALL